MESRMASSSSTTWMVGTLSVILFLDRYGEAEDGAAFPGGFGPQPSLVELDNGAADGQSDAHALRLGSVKRGEDLFQVVVGQPMALVGNGHFQQAVVDALGGHRQLTA